MALYDFLDGPPAPLNSQLMEKVNPYNLTTKINFSMGPSVKLVLAIIDSISKKNWGLIFFLAKLDTKVGGGSEGFVSDATKLTYLLFFNIFLILDRFDPSLEEEEKSVIFLI